MPTTKSKAQEAIMAVVGAGDFAVEKFVKAAKSADKPTVVKFYKSFIKRGETVTGRVKSSGATKQAAAQTKAARSQVKAAATSVTKAVRANAKATRKAPKAAASKPAKSAKAS